MNIQGELHALFTLSGLASLLTLSLLELILGVDNIIFISLLVIKLPESQRFKARVTGLSLAFVMRIIMLFCLVWLARITTTLFSVSEFRVTIRDILFLIGGSYLIFNTVEELTEHLKRKGHEKSEQGKKQRSYKSIIMQIVLIDFLFSFDSIFTAIGLNPNLVIMALAVGIGMVFMIYLAGHTSKFIEKNPAVKTLALSFIIAVGSMLVAEAFHLEIPKVYLYAALAVGLIAVGLNMALKSKTRRR